VYGNVAIYRRPFGSELGTRDTSKAWMAIAIFTISVVYCILYDGHWPVLRDLVNIIDKKNWGLFGIYTLFLWLLVLVIVPGIVYLMSLAGSGLAKIKMTVKEIFLVNAGTLLPLSLLLWISFVIPMLFVNITFIKQAASDPFGWGWDLFNAANTPWHQFLPRLIPWLQAMLLLMGFYYSLRNLERTWRTLQLKPKQKFMFMLPMGLFITGIAVAMVFFFTN
jgi:hypothetical protein